MESKKAIILFYFMTLAISVFGQDEGYMLHYDSPASSYLPNYVWGAGNNPPPTGTNGQSRDYFQEALLLGNGRFGAMFNGAIDEEHLVINEITAWMNTVRGRDEVSQTGARIGSHKYLEPLREATRNGQFGKDENSIEVLASKYFGSHTRLGNYAPFAEVFIATGHDESKVTDYQRKLNMRTGVGNVSYKIGDSKYTREYFCSYPNDLMAIRYTSDGEPLSLKIRTATKNIVKYQHGYTNRITLVGETPMVKDNMEFMQLIHVTTDDNNTFGIGATPDGVISVKNANEVTIYIAGYTDYLPDYPTFKGRDFAMDCENTISKVVASTYEEVKKVHIEDVSGLIDRCKLDLDFEPSGLTTDKLVEKGESIELENLYFNFARYLQTACSRGTAVPSNLQGLWNSTIAPSWNSDYHTDINLAMNYWMVETANLPEMFSPYIEWMKVMAESGKYTAKESFGAERGWTAGLNSNIFGFTAQNEHGRRMMHSGAWLAQNLYENFSFSRDDKKLADIYPIIKGAAEFYLEFLAPWKDGSLVVYPTWSPENNFLSEKYGPQNTLAYGASYDQQLIYNLFVDCIEASLLLDTDEEFRNELKSTIPKLCQQKIGQHGHIQEWPEDYDKVGDTHRHVSHLIALYPGRDFSLLTNKLLAEAAQKTLTARCLAPQGGWATAWRISLWARLFDGNKAHDLYRYLTTKHTTFNLYAGSRHFQIDGNLGGPAGVCEMLLQSHLRSIDNKAKSIEDAVFNAYTQDKDSPNKFNYVVPDDKLVDTPYIIHLLPALPDAWPKGSVKGLRARGGFETDIDWEDGKLVEANVRATKGGDFRIYSNGRLSKVISLKKGESKVWKY